MFNLKGPLVVRGPQFEKRCTTGFNVQKFHIPPTNSIYVLCMDLRTNRDYFPIVEAESSVMTARSQLKLYMPLRSVFMCTLLLPAGQTGEAWKPPKKKCPSGNMGALDTKVLMFINLSKDAQVFCREQLVRTAMIYTPRGHSSMSSMDAV